MKYGSCRCAHINAAGATQILHTADPDIGGLIQLAEALEHLRDRRVCVSRKENLLSSALIQGFFQLFCADNQLEFGQIQTMTAFRDYTIIQLIHTDVIIRKNSKKSTKILNKILCFFQFTPMSAPLTHLFSPGKIQVIEKDTLSCFCHKIPCFYL